MTESTQTVVEETKPEAKPSDAVETRTEKADADDVESLVEQFTRETTKPAADSPPKTEPDKPQWAVELENQYKQQQNERNAKEVREIASRVFDGLDVPPRMAKGWLEEYARENPKIGEAFQLLKHDSPEWRRIEKALSAVAKKEYGEKIDTVATADREAVAAAVRGASAKVAAEPAPNFGRMSDAELRQWKLDNLK